MTISFRHGGGKASRFLLFITCLLMAAMWTADLQAQDLRGKVTGTVTDASGAVIPGASVSLTNDNTTVATVTSTNEVGQYLFDFVIPGTYTVRVELEGFRTFEQQNILIQTRADITVNATMQVGAVAETVTVEEAPVAVQFTTTTMETTIDTKMSQELPLLNRNPYMLAALDPAVNYRGGAENAPYHHWAMSQLDVGGNTRFKNNVLMDGVPQLVGAKGVYTPPMDAVSEVNVQQNATDAEYGHSAGGIVSVQMKSGTNDWHGTGYFFGRNPAINARPNPLTRNPSVDRRNVWGVSSGNPIVKNRVFNYVTYEGQDVRSPSTVNLTLPRQLERTGDFSQSFNRSGGLRVIHDPWTTDPNGDNRMPFTNNTIPQSRIDPTSQTVLGKTWSPNNPGDNASGANNFRIVFPIRFEFWNLTNRTDWNVSDNVKVFGRLSRFHTIQSEPDYSGSVAQRRQGSERNSVQASGDVVWTVNPTTVVNVRGSWMKIVDSFSTPPSEIGEEGLAELWPGSPWYASHVRDIPAVHFPEINVQADGNTSFGRSGFWYQEPSTWNMEGKLSKQAGRHYLKYGGQFRKQLVEAGRPRGMRFRFSPTETADTINSPNTGALGHAWASMVLGVMADGNLSRPAYSRVRTVATNRPRVDVYGFYVHDDFKVNQKVTLNLGLRYEYETPMLDPENRLSRTIDFSQALPEIQSAMGPIADDILAMRTRPLDISGAWLFTDSNNRRTWIGQKNVFLPRAGIAIRLNDRSALRIGYARYATPPVQERSALGILGSTPYPGFEIEGQPLRSINGTPRAVFSNPFPSGGEHPNPLPEPNGQKFGRFATVGSNEAIGFNQDWSAGINDRFNVTYQQEIMARIVVDATFFSNFGHNQPFNWRPNLFDPRIGFQHGSRINASVDNPFFGLPEEIMPGPLRNQRTVRVSQLLVPYPHYLSNGIQIRGVNARSERYNAFQLQVQRPFANGFNFLLGYNYNRSRLQTFYDSVDEIDRNFTYLRDRAGRNKLTLAGIYELPFGNGKPIGNNLSGAAQKVLGGWQVSGIFVYQGGQFLDFGGAIMHADPAIGSPQRGPGGDGFRRTFFRNDVLGRGCTSGCTWERLPAFTRRGNPRFVDGVNGPRFQNVDFILSKVTEITEKLKFELRMEAYNLTNSFMGNNPSTNVNAGTFGQVSSKLRTHFGRSLQYSGRFIW